MTARLGLGTVQFGMPYGATNTGGQVPVAEVGAILHAAAAIGIDLLDTAAGYGTAEQALGAALRPEHRFAVVTKTLRLDRPVVSRDDVGHLIQAVHQSLRALNRPRVEGLLVKSAADLTAPGGDLLVDALRRVQAEGYVGRLGLSLYPDDPLDAVLARFTPDIVQLPLSVLDRRVLDNGMLLRLRDAGVEIHVRSALMQGLLAVPLDKLPIWTAPWHHHFKRLHAAAPDLLAAALGFVGHCPLVDRIIVGVTSAAELEQVSAALDRGDGRLTDQAFACDDPRLIHIPDWPVK